jgi:hypothetical protein|tara:strand:+ start:384 stop:1040 length:657 start_codon:yes stop_codon:yes gene_type:complete
MTYPITIVDNFFEDPDGIVEQAMELRYYTPNSGNWPGTRTKSLHVEQPRFFSHFGQKLHLLHYESAPEYWNLQCHYQLIHPFAEDKYSKKNRGWVHKDIDTWFGGIVYLSKKPEPDTGTSIYRVKRGFSHQTADEIGMKEALYRSENIDDLEYEKAYDTMRNQFEETVTIENVYNRFVMFNGNTHHGVQTFGSKPRLTLNFFGMAQTGKIPPLLRANR